MSLAATKRKIGIGAQLKLVRHDWIATGGIVVHGNLGPVRIPSKIQIGSVRSVVSASTKEIGLATGDNTSYLTWPGASNYRDTPNGFEIDLNSDGLFTALMGYEFVPEPD